VLFISTKFTSVIPAMNVQNNNSKSFLPLVGAIAASLVVSLPAIAQMTPARSNPMDTNPPARTSVENQPSRNTDRPSMRRNKPIGGITPYTNLDREAPNVPSEFGGEQLRRNFERRLAEDSSDRSFPNQSEDFNRNLPSQDENMNQPVNPPARTAPENQPSGTTNP
jgi:hypothetical protein